MAATTHYTSNFGWASSPPTYAQIRDLPDAISTVAPSEAVLQNALTHGDPVKTWSFQWMMLQPPRATATNAEVVDSVPPDSDASQTLPVYPVSACYQDDTVVATNLVPRTEANHMGAGDFHAKQCALYLEEFVHRQEYNLSYQSYAIGDASSTPAKTHGLIPWVFDGGLGRARTTNVALGATTLSYAYNPLLKKHASGSPLSEDSFHEGLQDWSYLGNDVQSAIALMSPKVKKRFRNFVRLYKPGATEQSQLSYFRNIDERMAGLVVEFFETDMGIVELVSLPEWARNPITHTTPDVNSAGTMAVVSDNMIVVLDPAYVEIVPFHGYFSYDKPGDGRNISTVFSYTGGLKVLNGRALLGYYNCDGTAATVA